MINLSKRQIFGFILLGLVLMGSMLLSVRANRLSDSRIQDAFYGKIDKFPSGVYTEDGQSVSYISSRTESRGILCTDDSKKAKEWAEMNIKGSAYYKSFVAESATEKYFQYNTIDSTRQEQFTLGFRVDKCAYIDRSSLDNNGNGGIFQKKSFTKEDIKILGEYLLYGEINRISGSAILESDVSKGPTTYTSTIYYTTGSHGDWGLCDQISLVKRDTIVNKLSGSIQISHSVQKKIQGQCN